VVGPRQMSARMQCPGKGGKKGKVYSLISVANNEFIRTTTQITFRSRVLRRLTFPTFPTFPAAV
jgi:hypothetical protein